MSAFDAITFGLAGLGVGIAIAPSAPPPPVNAPVWSSLELADGVPANNHLMLAPESGVSLGCWWQDDRTQSTACYWLVETGERVDLPDPVAGFTPRSPLPGVDPITGSAMFECWSDDNQRRVHTLVIPDAIRTADFNGDGVVNTQDQLAFLNAWAVQRSDR